MLTLVAVLVVQSILMGTDVRLPMSASVVTPAPVPEVVFAPVTTLAHEEWYVIESDEPITVIGSPEDIVSVESVVGPQNYRGKFSEEPGIQKRRMEGPYLFEVSALKTGKCELIIVAVIDGKPVEKSRHSLTVTGPRPPPIPEPDPKPDPDPPQPTVKNVSVAIVEDTMNRSPDMAILMNGLVAWTDFVDDGNDWRSYDKSTSEARGKKAVSVLAGVVPGIVISDKATGKVIHSGAMPATLADLKTLIGGLTGG